MKKIANSLLQLILFIQPAISGELAKSSYYVSSYNFEWSPGAILCKIKQSIGFDWKNGAYIKQNFTEYDYVIKKLTNSEKESTPNCLSLLSKEDDELVTNSVKLNFVNRCYRINRIGAEPHAGICTEFYKNQILETISCDDDSYKFHPSGIILISPSNASKDISKDANYKDSFAISHGLCSPI